MAVRARQCVLHHLQEPRVEWFSYFSGHSREPSFVAVLARQCVLLHVPEPSVERFSYFSLAFPSAEFRGRACAAVRVAPRAGAQR
jgi:hypothetical protein